MVGHRDIADDVNELSHRVIGAAIAVHRALGPGFAESTYAKAMEVELSASGIDFVAEHPVQLRYREQVIATGRIDLLVASKLVVELKAVEESPRQYRRQVVAYLKATGLQLGLLINFGAGTLKEGVLRVIHT
jgi:GxxExxY protein